MILQCTCKFNFNSFQCNDTTKKYLILFYFIRTLIFFLCVFHVGTNFCLTPVCAMIREWKKCSNKSTVYFRVGQEFLFSYDIFIYVQFHTLFSLYYQAAVVSLLREQQTINILQSFSRYFFFQLYVSSSHDFVRYWRIYYFNIEFYRQKSFVTVGEENIPEKHENSLFRHCWMKQFGWRRTFNEGIFVWICTCVNISQSLLNNMHPNMCHPRVCMY